MLALERFVEAQHVFIWPCALQALHTAEPLNGKSSKATQAQQQGADAMQQSKGAKRKQPEPEQKLLASSQSADALTVSAPPPTVSPSPPAQQEERIVLRKPTGGRGYQSKMCEECQRRHKGHCGTERAVKSCLRRQPAQPAQSAQPGITAVPSQVPQAASGAQRQGAALSKEQATGRTLGIAAQLQALSRRPSDAGEAAQAHAAAQAGQKPVPPGQPPRPPGQPRPKAAPQELQQPGHKDAQKRARKKQRTAGKQASWSTGETEDTWTDGAAAERVRPAVPAPADASEPNAASKQKKVTNGKQAKEQKAEAVKVTAEPLNAASASQNRASAVSMRKASAANHDSISSAPQHGGSSRSKLSKGSGPSLKAPSSKLRKLTKAGNISTVKQASPVSTGLLMVFRLILGWA